MNREDYLKLDKERLAEMLVERDQHNAFEQLTDYRQTCGIWYVPNCTREQRCPYTPYHTDTFTVTCSITY